MEKKIMFTESAPDKRHLWLHYKNNNLVLEAFGNRGWESVGDDPDSNSSNGVQKREDEINKESTTIKVELPELTEKCSKQLLISTIETLKEALVKSGLIEIV